MSQEKIKVTLSDGNSILKNWEQSYEADLPGLVDAIKHVKQSVNDYLTHLVDQGKSPVEKQKSEQTIGEVEEEAEEEQNEDDVISGFIKNIATEGENLKRSKKQKNNFSELAKKQKK